MPLFDWDGSLNLGEATLDRQHKGLMGLINQVADALEHPDRETEIMECLSRMFLYAKEHFFDEEAFMARLGYPGREAHTAMHKAFVQQAQELTDACLDDSMHAPDLLAFLVDWLQQHIAVEDAKIVAFAQGQGAA